MNKETRINVRANDDMKRDLEITAKLRGLTVSSLVKLLVQKAIREEKQIYPEAFEHEKGSSSRSTVGLETASGTEDTPAWQQGLRRAKGMWKERNDLPDLRQLRMESDRSERWEKP